jgi:oxygen-independent coproporphyrinogen-3 oxidase
VFRFQAPPPLSLYIHFPWCVRKCPYCDFNSHGLQGELPEERYVDALLGDLEQELPAVWGRMVQTVFMGGGTPSLFSAPAMERLLSGIRARLPLQPDPEITLEANPGTVDEARFAGYREAGINRLSLGIQSFSDTHLQALGRIHSSDQGFRATEAARGAGFTNINLDLMFGLPGQDVAEAIADLRRAAALEPEHLSWYQLTIEPNTLFHARPPELPDDDIRWNMQRAARSLLAGGGYTHYEVSAFAREGRECRHNLNYWRFGDYIGIGAGAHGKITDAGHGRIRRISKRRHPRDYLENAGSPGCIVGQRELREADAVFEFVLNRLRLKQPLVLEEFESGCGLDSAWIMPAIESACEAGLLHKDGLLIRHTDKGWLFLDDLLQHFLPEVIDNAREHMD